ncbi:carbohydrate ABC transporter permease [Actinopolymorpha pittospori]|uniref:Multiple sugar transport system permease protein n=1 Tax=Actinopolymorpha pittospori TaxID=648752 RepID=A0A927N6Q5_9ACTN|nr:sugar ABC transporter permease [Actinopolymorpha pittospori]MBE1613089.1 multiple sugar transport system permease protein [Actinopolymorpha pittospori]
MVAGPLTAPPTAARSPRSSGSTGSTGPGGIRRWVPWAFIAPNLIGLFVFTLVPVFAGLAISFTNWNVVSGLGGIQYAGVTNFTNLFSDVEFWRALARTVFYAGMGVTLSIGLGLLLALALNQPVLGRGLLRAVFFVPSMVNAVAIGMVWLLVLHPTSGLLNRGLQVLGVGHPPGWLVSDTWALPALVLIHVWATVGYTAVIYLAALQDMPQDLYEAAMVDGAGVWRRFVTVTWPGLMPTTTFLAITSLIGTSQGFGLIAFLTQGGPGDSSTTVLAYYMYQNGFQFYRFGYAAAMGVVTFVGVLVLTLLMWRYQRGRGLYT